MTRPLPRRRLLGLPLAAFIACARGQAAIRHLNVAGSHIEVQFDDDMDLQVVDDAMAWVTRSAQAVADYLGRFPQPGVVLLLVASDGAGARSGVAYAQPEPSLRVRIGRATRAPHLVDDWILVHEMMHLAIPQVRRRHLWLHEGIATYTEGVVRVRAGLNSAERWWGEMVRGLPQGLPAEGDRGLDFTPTWGRTYWGGALFCLLADVKMRQAGRVDRGLREALQGLLAAGGNYAVEWPVERILAEADKAVDGHTLADLYEAMKDQPHPVDLPALWRELGIETSQALSPSFDAKAPLAPIRTSITA